MALAIAASMLMAPVCSEPDDTGTGDDTGSSDTGEPPVGVLPVEIDTAGNVGHDNEIAFVDGEPHIVYYDWNEAQADVKHAERRDDGWHVEVLLSDNRNGPGVSRPAIAAYNGNPVVISSKRSGANHSLVALERDAAGVWQETVLDPGHDTFDGYEAPDYADVVNLNGELVVAYTTHGDVNVLRLVSRSAQGWTTPVDVVLASDLAPDFSPDTIREPAIAQTSLGIVITYLVSPITSAGVSWEEPAGNWNSALLQNGRARHPDVSSLHDQPALAWGSEEFEGEWRYRIRMLVGGPEVWTDPDMDPEILAPPTDDPLGETGQEPCLASLDDQLVVVYARTHNGYERLSYSVSHPEGSWEHVIFEGAEEYIANSQYLSCASSEGRIAVAWYGLGGHLWYLDDLLAAGEAL